MSLYEYNIYSETYTERSDPFYPISRCCLSSFVAALYGVECCCCALRRLCGIMSAKDAEIFSALHLST